MANSGAANRGRENYPVASQMITQLKEGGEYMEYREVVHNMCKCMVTEDGHVKSLGSSGNMVERPWRYNADGYPVISATGFDQDGNKIYRTIAVHILVAKAWVDNPLNKPEVNHLDFNRRNPVASNLEWVTHKENIEYSSSAGRHMRLFGSDNPNYKNTTLKEKYSKNKALSKEKQSRPDGQNGRSIPCHLETLNGKFVEKFVCQKHSVEWLMSHEYIRRDITIAHAITKLRGDSGYCGYKIIIDKK